jgi:Fe-S-cluster-containing dehydrogenase component
MCLDSLSGGRAPACGRACRSKGFNGGHVENLMQKYGKVVRVEDSRDCLKNRALARLSISGKIGRAVLICTCQEGKQSRRVHSNVH